METSNPNLVIDIAAITGGVISIGNIILTYLSKRRETDVQEAKVEREAETSVAQLRLEIEQRVWERVKSELEEAYLRNDEAEKTIRELRETLVQERNGRVELDAAFRTVSNEVVLLRQEVSLLKREVEMERTARVSLQKENEELRLQQHLTK